MLLFAPYLLDGGCSRRPIGVSSIPIVNVGNLINDTFTLSYPGDQSGVGVDRGARGRHYQRRHAVFWTVAAFSPNDREYLGKHPGGKSVL
jgi:hypothetical protein